MVSHRFLIPVIEGSNPSSPTNLDYSLSLCSDEHLVQRHEEVPTVDELLRVLSTLAETVLSLAAAESS